LTTPNFDLEYDNLYIVSPGRSGSSFLADLLVHAGYTLTTKNSPMSPGRGLFLPYAKHEDVPCRTLQEKEAERQLGDARATGPIKITEDFKKRAQSLLHRFPEPFALKIPNQSIKFIDAWGLKPVGIVREPGLVLESYMERQGFNATEQLTEFYELLLKRLEKDPFPVFVFDEWLTVAHIDDTLGIVSDYEFDHGRTAATGVDVPRRLKELWEEIEAYGHHQLQRASDSRKKLVRPY